jgi:hypothetical protein
LAGFPAIFNAAASGMPAPGYQWQTSANGGSSWTNVTDGAPYGGTATGTLTITSATTAMNGSQYRCVATNGTRQIEPAIRLYYAALARCRIMPACKIGPPTSMQGSSR